MKSWCVNTPTIATVTFKGVVAHQPTERLAETPHKAKRYSVA